MSSLNNQTTKETKIKEMVKTFGIKDFMSFIKKNYKKEYDDFVNNGNSNVLKNKNIAFKFI